MSVLIKKEQSFYGLPLKARCDSYSCDNSGEQCEEDGVLVTVYQGSTNNDRLNDGHWEQYPCEKAINIDKTQGFEVVVIGD